MKYYLLLCAPLLFLASSCADVRKAAYFPGQGNAEIASTVQAPRQVIEINDVLSITVTSLSNQSASAFNQPNTSGTASFTTSNYSSGLQQAGGYMVGPDGYIKFPVLGKVKAADLTTDELEEFITRQMLEKQLLLEPMVSVRNLNFKITVLGEVARPTVITVPNAKISLLEAIGMAGDLTIYGKRDNVLLIREEKGKKITARINLNSNQLFESPYYYLKAGDVLYVQPNNAKVTAASRGKEVLPIVFSALSFTVIALDILTRR